MLEQEVALLQDQERLEQNLLVASPGAPPDLEVLVPQSLLAKGHWSVLLDVYTSNDESMLGNRRNRRVVADFDPRPLPDLKVETDGNVKEALEDTGEHETNLAGHPFRKQTFALVESADASDIIKGFHVVMRLEEGLQNGLLMYFATTRAVPVAATPTEGETVLWQ